MGVMYLKNKNGDVVKYGGRDADGSNIKVTFKGEERQLNNVLNELSIEFVNELPEEVIEKIFGIEHTIAVSKDLNIYADDLLGSYFHLSGSKYIVNEATTVTYNGATVTEMTVGPTDYTDNNGNKFNFLDKYDFTVTVNETHTDYYIGDKATNEYTQLADMKEVQREFIPITEKGTAGGVASLDANGMIPISQMPTQSQIYIGEWDASTGNIPPEPTRSGVYYNISKEGTIDNVHYNVNDWIIWDGTKWNKQVQTSDVSSVDGMKGAVNLEDKYVQLNADNTGTGNITMNKFSGTEFKLTGIPDDAFRGIKNENGSTSATVGSVFANNIKGVNSTDAITVGQDSAHTYIKGADVNFCGVSANDLKSISEKHLTNGTDVLAYVDSLQLVGAVNGDGFVHHFRCIDGVNSPVGNGNNDFHYTLKTIENNHGYWKKLIAEDIRSNARYVNTKMNNVWSGWVKDVAFNTGLIANLDDARDTGIYRGQFRGNNISSTGNVITLGGFDSYSKNYTNAQICAFDDDEEGGLWWRCSDPEDASWSGWRKLATTGYMRNALTTNALTSILENASMYGGWQWTNPNSYYPVRFTCHWQKHWAGGTLFAHIGNRLVYKHACYDMPYVTNDYYHTNGTIDVVLQPGETITISADEYFLSGNTAFPWWKLDSIYYQPIYIYGPNDFIK